MAEAQKSSDSQLQAYAVNKALDFAPNLYIQPFHAGKFENKASGRHSSRAPLIMRLIKGVSLEPEHHDTNRINGISQHPLAAFPIFIQTQLRVVSFKRNYERFGGRTLLIWRPWGLLICEFIVAIAGTVDGSNLVTELVAEVGIAENAVLTLLNYLCQAARICCS